MLAQGALVQTALVAIPGGAAAVPDYGWYQPLSDPAVRIKRGLAASNQQALGAPPLPAAVPFNWFSPLAEPIRVPQRLRPSQQPFLALHPTPVVPFEWFEALSDPTVKLKLGLSAALQQHPHAWPPRLLPTPTITGVLDAVETKDSGLFGAMRFARAATVEIGLAERIDRPLLGALEIAPPSVMVGTIESPLSPSAGTAVPAAAEVLLTIREL
jgi:hypothetical protein